LPLWVLGSNSEGHLTAVQDFPNHIGIDGDREALEFSKGRLEQLDMRMDRDLELSIYDVVNGYSQTELEYIFREYGEVSQFKRLAQTIVEARSRKAIESGRELSQIISSTIWGGRVHPATLPFQAIRIEVNSELQEIEGLLDILEHKGRNGELSGAVVSLITFHSLEDRLVKLLFKKPITASQEELKLNPRSRSAKLRSFRFNK